MKRFINVILIFALLLSFTFISASAIRIDGSDSEFEWDGAECIRNVIGADSNNVEFALIKCCFDDNGYDAYFMLYMTDDLSDSLDNCGFILTINDGVEITVTSSDVVSDAAPDLYNVTAKMNIVESDGVYCEIKVSFKKGLPDTVSGTVSYVDGTGNNSYFYPFSFVYKDAVTTVTVAENSTLKPTARVTKEKTTKQKATSKSTTTKQSASKTTQKAEKTTKKQKENKTVVYFYEKEVVISQVYVSETVNNVITAEESTTAPSSVQAIQSNYQTADGIAIQKIICALGGVILVAFAAWAGLSAKKKPKEKASNNSEKSE